MRPSKLTPERAKVICESRKLGATIDHCAARAGIKSPTLYGWLAKGKREVSCEKAIVDLFNFSSRNFFWVQFL